jgi:hypothetical protein
MFPAQLGRFSRTEKAEKAERNAHERATKSDTLLTSPVRRKREGNCANRKVRRLVCMRPYWLVETACAMWCYCVRYVVLLRDISSIFV